MVREVVGNFESFKQLQTHVKALNLHPKSTQTVEGRKRKRLPEENAKKRRRQWPAAAAAGGEREKKQGREEEKEEKKKGGGRRKKQWREAVGWRGRSWGPAGER